MKTKTTFSVFFAILAATACSKTSSDPDTNDRSEFNPPGKLQTITMDEKLVLTWVGANAEDDFQGYHVFGRKGAITDLADKYSFPTATIDFANGESIPRCEDNTAFFEYFGFPATDTSCDTSEEEATDEATLTTAKKSFLMAEDEAEAIDFNLKCTGTGQVVADGSLSLAATDGKQIGRVYCDIEQVYDPDAGEFVDLVNGDTYTFFVVAVKGSDKDEISWISNVAEDTPAVTMYSDVIELTTSLPGTSAAQYVNFALDVTAKTATASSPTACTSSDGMCHLTATQNNALGGIYIGRDTVSDVYAQRILISTSTLGKVQIRPRGANTMLNYTGDEDELIPYKPGDQAIATATSDYPAKGVKFAVYGNQVFDFVYIDGDTKHYGKVVVTDLSYGGATKHATAELAVTIVMQPDLDNVHYFN